MSSIALVSNMDHEVNIPKAISSKWMMQKNMTDRFDIEACTKSLINIVTGLHTSKLV